jgi:hypothetical protein
MLYKVSLDQENLGQFMSGDFITGNVISGKESFIQVR